MKEIVAMIRINMINQTRQALVEAGFSAFTVRKVLGRGKGEVDFRVLSAAAEGLPDALPHLNNDGPMLVAKRQLNIVVEDNQVEKVVETLIKINKTGNRGDGKIFIVPIDDAVRVRTREEGSAALA
ncbi:nitrogen fixation protein [Achromatium sp. WMS2]|nr:nitrogen fixation protein [Achromatium sp. WMS2]